MLTLKLVMQKNAERPDPAVISPSDIIDHWQSYIIRYFVVHIKLWMFSYCCSQRSFTPLTFLACDRKLGLNSILYSIQ